MQGHRWRLRTLKGDPDKLLNTHSGEGSKHRQDNWRGAVQAETTTASPTGTERDRLVARNAENRIVKCRSGTIFHKYLRRIPLDWARQIRRNTWQKPYRLAILGVPFKAPRSLPLIGL